jgi:probable FeS assembly SUF system protein SufT
MSEINKELIKVNRDCDAILIPGGEKVVLVEGTHVRITQALGGDYTVYVNGNLLKVSGKDADAIGIKIKNDPIKKNKVSSNKIITEEDAWDVMKTCYDPEIPVNVVDLGLIYDLKMTDSEQGIKINVKMTLTAPGCGMGPVIAQDVEDKLMGLPNVLNVQVELVWDPVWNQSMMTDSAKLELGML